MFIIAIFYHGPATSRPGNIADSQCIPYARFLEFASTYSRPWIATRHPWLAPTTFFNNNDVYCYMPSRPGNITHIQCIPSRSFSWSSRQRILAFESLRDVTGQLRQPFCNDGIYHRSMQSRPGNITHSQWIARARFLEVRTKIFSYFVGRATSLTSSDNLSATIVFIITDICHSGLVTSQSRVDCVALGSQVSVNVFSPSNHYATPLAFDWMSSASC